MALDNLCSNQTISKDMPSSFPVQNYFTEGSLDNIS